MTYKNVVYLLYRFTMNLTVELESRVLVFVGGLDIYDYVK